MMGFSESEYGIQSVTTMRTPSGMHQLRELRKSADGKLYVAVNGQTETAVIDLLFYFSSDDIAMQEWTTKFLTDPALKASQVEYTSVVKHHAIEYFKDGTVVMH